MKPEDYIARQTALNKTLKDLARKELIEQCAPVDASVHRERIAANTAPGNVVTRVCTLTQCLIDEVLDLDSERGDAHATLVMPYLERGETIWVYFYDGDSGECMKTIITKPAVEQTQKRGH